MLQNRENETAYFISVIALEECGKTAILDEIIWNTRVNEMDYRSATRWWKWIFDHKLKQRFPISHLTKFDVPKLTRLYTSMQRGDLERKKQNALYVGLSGRDIRGRILVPEVKRPAVKRQMRLLNDLLIEVIERKLEFDGLFDGDFVDKMLNRRLLKELQAIKSEIS